MSDQTHTETHSRITQCFFVFFLANRNKKNLRRENHRTANQPRARTHKRSTGLKVNSLHTNARTHKRITHANKTQACAQNAPRISTQNGPRPCVSCGVANCCADAWLSITENTERDYRNEQRLGTRSMMNARACTRVCEYVCECATAMTCAGDEKQTRAASTRARRRPRHRRCIIIRCLTRRWLTRTYTSAFVYHPHTRWASSVRKVTEP